MYDNTDIDGTADEAIFVDKKEYDELRRKANALDILTADIQMNIDSDYQYDPVRTELVMLLTGMKAYLQEKRQWEARKSARKEEDDE